MRYLFYIVFLPAIAVLSGSLPAGARGASHLQFQPSVSDKTQTAVSDAVDAPVHAPIRSEMRPKPTPAVLPNAVEPAGPLAIPGPLSALLRMAGISQQVSPAEVLPLVARNAMSGYQAGEPSTYLVLLRRYVQQAREIMALADADGVLRVDGCGGSTMALLKVLGYRVENGDAVKNSGPEDPQGVCGPNAALETADPERAFLTVDSGFPLAELEDTLRTAKPFAVPFSATRVPMIFSEADWMALGVNSRASRPNQNAAIAGAPADLLDLLLRDPVVARLYWSMSRMDQETATALRTSLRKLLPYAAALDFYGAEISVREGKVVVPGGAASEAAWAALVGVDSDSPEAFIVALLGKDQGGLAAYFDALSRLHRSQQAYFTEPARLGAFYAPFRQEEKFPPLSQSLFHPFPGLLILMSRLQFDANGQPHVPGSLAVWKEIVARKAGSKVARAKLVPAADWNEPQELLQALFAFSRTYPYEGLLPLYLDLSEMDRGRPANRKLSPQIVALLAGKFQRLGRQYTIFCEFGGLDEESIASFLNTAEGLSHIHDRALRSDALGIFEANVGIWQILARQGQIKHGDWNTSWQRLMQPFAKVTSSAQLFETGRASVRELARSASGRSEFSQAELLALLAGPEQESTESRQVRQYLVRRMMRVLKDQQMVSLDTLFALGDGLNLKAKGERMPADLLLRAQELRLELPQPMLTDHERVEYYAGPFNDHHTSMELKTELSGVLKSAASAKAATEAKGQLTPFLRDTLVAMNYAYYEPPGSELLHHNALFVRSHDFSPDTGFGGSLDWQTPQLYGKGNTAVGNARLVGSLVDLPYVLAGVEQNLLIPKNLQALIWEALVPSLLDGATLPRWWNVMPAELHAAALYQRAGEELMIAAVQQPALRQQVLDILSDCMFPHETRAIEYALEAGNAPEAVAQLLPAESFYLTAEFSRRFPQQKNAWGPAGLELRDLGRRNPQAASVQKLSTDFGVPHPALTRNYSLDLLNARIFPSFAAYSSQLLAESWESTNLYWARIADEMGYAPVLLNRIVPETTLRMVEMISASHFDDWRALVRAMKAAGDDLRTGELNFGAPTEIENAGLHSTSN